MRALIATLLVVGLLAAAPSAASAATIFVDDDDPGGPGCGSQSNPCNTVQEGVDAASAGDLVLVGVGTYVEQVDIDKAITLRGAGEGATQIRSPDATLLLDKFGDDDRRPVVFVHDLSMAGATIERLTVNGFAEAGPSCDFTFLGIAYVNAGGTVRQTTVKHVRNAPLNDCQSGLAIYSLNDDAEERSWTVENSVVSGYQKNGITANGVALEATISGNVVTGAGAQEELSQNGIQLGFGAGGTVSGNAVTGNACDHPDCDSDPVTGLQAAGILLSEAPDGTEILGNEVHGNDTGVLDDAGAGTRMVFGNDLSNNRFIGLFTDDATTALSENDLSGSEVGLAAVSYDGGTDPDFVPTVVATGNTLAGGGTGVLVARDDSGTDAPVVAAHFNRIAGNDTGLTNDTDAAVDVENNWWGCNDGPTGPACDSIGGSGASAVDADPFLVMRLSKGVKKNGRRDIWATARFNSEGVKFKPIDFPDGTEVAFTTTRGTIPSIGTMIDGKALVIHRKAGSTHKATITATLDAQALEIRAR